MASIRKRKWVYEGKEAEAWVVRYKSQDGKWRLKTFDTQKEAKAWSINALHEVQIGTHTPASASKTVEEAWELWIGECEANKIELGNIKKSKQHLKQHIKPLIGQIKLSDLTTPMVYEFDRKLRDQGRSVAMRRKVITNLKTMLTYAQGHGPLVAQNVALGVRIGKDEREATTGPLRAGVDFPSMAELKLLIENAAGHWRPLIITAIFTGMRASELRGLPWCDVDLDAGVVHVRQ